METSNQPQPVEYYGSIWFNLIFGLFGLAVGGFCIFGLTLMWPVIVQPGLWSMDLAAAFLALPSIAAFCAVASMRMLRRVCVPKPEFRFDSHGITIFDRSGNDEFVPWSDTGATNIGWTSGRNPTRYLKLKLREGKQRVFPDLLLSVSLEELQATIIEFQLAYGACVPTALQGADDQRAEKIGLSGWVIGIAEVIANFL